jgi:hypothetical protein
MSGQIDYIAEAKNTFEFSKVHPDPTNSYEMQLVTSQNQSEFNKVWEDSKALFRQYKDDRIGVSTARRRLALLFKKAQQEGWRVDGQAV